MSAHEYVKPGQVAGFYSPPPDACMTCGQPQLAHDWRVLREWLIKTRADAQHFATKTHRMPAYEGFQAQVEVLSSVLDFMDARERAQ